MLNKAHHTEEGRDKNENKDKSLKFQEWHKGFLKDCPSGELTKDQFSFTYSKMFPTGNADKFVDNVFRTFDKSRSISIGFMEFMPALPVTSSGTREEKMKWAFMMYDVNGSGSIDFNEMKRFVKAN